MLRQSMFRIDPRGMSGTRCIQIVRDQRNYMSVLRYNFAGAFPERTGLLVLFGVIP